MNIKQKTDEAYKTIGEISKELGLIDPKTGRLQTHTLRYWETQFKQIRPSVKAGRRRYYSKKDFMIISRIKFLLKDKGLTINGVKKILNSDNRSSLDDNVNLGVYKQNFVVRKNIKNKLKKISKIVKELKDLK